MSSFRHPSYLADKILRDAAEAPDATDAAKEAYKLRMQRRERERRDYEFRTLNDIVVAQQTINNPHLGEFEKNLANALLKRISADNHNLEVLKARANAPGASVDDKEAYIHETYKGIPLPLSAKIEAEADRVEAGL